MFSTNSLWLQILFRKNSEIKNPRVAGIVKGLNKLCILDSEVIEVGIRELGANSCENYMRIVGRELGANSCENYMRIVGVE